ncbi:MAG TPA: zinc-binding dehydrogenase [Pseudorhodoferax sp.]|jgi:threonine dehydrogenase-like Zn-dependent dehydrogenase|nr:zinc-binding dehydrogenase [Pseudorhodoferax sp.]
MKAVVARQGALRVEELAEPVPASGQVLVRTLACGICGTDLHARHHLHGFLQGLLRSGNPLPTDPDGGVVFGHEFCGEVLEPGPGTTARFPAGTRVVGLPFVTGPQGAEYVGYSNRFPGGFGERMVLTERLLYAVPNGLPAAHAALTEPMAVGAHAVARAGIEGPAVCMVVGCGPIGLAVIAALKARGIGPVVALDYSAGRRGFALRIGADEVVDPAVEAAPAVWARTGAGRKGRRAVVFECVGRPGVAQAVLADAPRQALLVVVGNALEDCSLDQVMAFNKELDIRFSANFTPAEFERTLHDLAEGRIDPRHLLTGEVPPEGVEQAFADLGDADRHAKIVVRFDL